MPDKPIVPIVSIAPGLVTALLAEAARAHPGECCGLLLGAEAGAADITGILPTPNIASEPERYFEIDPAALIAAWRDARSGGPAILGYYHSHPSGGRAPSRTDRAMAAHDGRIWAIIAGGGVAFWRDGDEGFEALSSEGAES